MLPRRIRRSGKGKTIIRKPLHISARIQVTIAILMVTLTKSVGNYIQS